MENNPQQILKRLGARSSISKKHGLSLITDKYLTVFSPGISTGGFAEIRMALLNKKRKIIATTIDKKGLETAKENVRKLNLEKQIKAKLEDLREKSPYKNNYFDFIYAHLVLHYLSAQD